MILLLAGVIGVLYAAGTYLLLQRSLTRTILGLAAMSHGANLLLLASGGRPGSTPFARPGRTAEEMSDPLPQALALTAIVITFATTALLLALALRSWHHTRDDEVQDDVEDRRIAALEEEAQERAE